MREILACWLALILMSGLARAADKELQVITGDMSLYSSVPLGQTPGNGFTYLNNTYGRGDLTNGRDYLQKLTANPGTFPIGARFEWSWNGRTCSGCGPFAYSYPLINYGASNYDNPFKVVGPWPQQIKRNATLRVTYDISLAGNLNSFDTLLDVFLTAAPNSESGAYVAEVSFFPQSNDVKLIGKPHSFTFGQAYVGSQGNPPQICVSPSDATSRRNILSGTIDLREILQFLVAEGFLTGEEWLRGIQFGVEVQVPAAYNTPPYEGSMVVNKLSYEWR